MRAPIVVLLLALTATLGTARATPLEALAKASVSKLEFGSFKLEVALAGIKDWPFPIEGTSVSSHIDPDKIEIVVAVSETGTAAFRDACARTLGRVREFLYVHADGTAPMGRSFLGNYFQGSWHRDAREAALRELDAVTWIRVDVVGRGSCQAALVGAPVTFQELPSK
jgi:hypothetical protein